VDEAAARVEFMCERAVTELTKANQDIERGFHELEAMQSADRASVQLLGEELQAHQVALEGHKIHVKDRLAKQAADYNRKITSLKCQQEINTI